MQPDHGLIKLCNPPPFATASVHRQSSTFTPGYSLVRRALIVVPCSSSYFWKLYINSNIKRFVYTMEDTESVATLLEQTTIKIQQLQKAFAELESHRAVTLTLKWKQIEDHFHGLENSLKRRFTKLEDQEKEFKNKTIQSQKLLENREAAVLSKEQDSLQKLQEKRDAAVTTITHINDIKKSTEHDLQELTNPELVKLCKEMDYQGLHKFISDNRKNLASVKDEIPIALKAAVDPGGLVLDSLNGFYTSEVKKDSNLLGLRRTCIMLMECFSVFLTKLDKETICMVVSNDVKNRAKIIARKWKPNLDDIGIDVDDNNGNSLKAHAFLQLVATFRINCDFDKEDLCKLIPMVSRRRQVADLCGFLGLSDKIPGVINMLINNGRHINAVNLAFAFNLTEQFSPVSLLKSYLTDARKHCSPTNQNDANEKELCALKAIIKCIEEHKLENQYPLDPLQKRALQLEKVNKRATEVSKPQHKRPRANGVAVYNTPHNPNPNHARITNWYAPQTHYVHDHRLYGYPVQPENHMGSFIGVVGPNHGGYFVNGYQYQAAYIH